MSSAGSLIPVRVAVRFRPLNSKELKEGCEKGVSVIDGRQVCVDSTRNAFTYDFVFGEELTQEEVYDKSTKELIPQLFKGYNVTVLAYGQTGSGKTHTMGTTNSPSTKPEILGIIPRAIEDIFQFISKESKEYSFVTKVSFIELYKENLFDLLSKKSAKKEECSLDIREDPRVGLHIANLTEVPVHSLSDTVLQLENGSKKRVTAATAMNNVSSRPHAIFTFQIERTSKDNDVLVAKFHLVDLAGSERKKKTKATGERLKEGIDINKGLLALGNVIAALGEESSSSYKHIPYRDSKLTRLLQDSLGGNSHTLMIACSSPADSNLDETISTLRYADRARKIKNKPIVNREGKEIEIKKLKSEIAALKVQLENGGTSGLQSNGVSEKELEVLQEVTNKLKTENKELTSALMTVQEELTHLNEGIMMTESVNEKLKAKIQEFSTEFKSKMGDSNDYQEVYSKIQEVIETYNDSEKKMVEFEMSRGHQTIVKEEEGAESDEESGEADETQTAHALRQNHLANELKSLNKLLAQKEQLATAMNQNDEKFNEMKKKYEESINNMENEIEKMNKEMEELVRISKKEGGHSKISEQRRKRIQELEGLIQDMKRKLLEQQKAIKLNEKDKTKMMKLSQEIIQMKQQKVKLVRQMKEDAEKMRAWKQQKERELCKVKQSERKNLVKITKMENLHTKQMNVWKRKIEEVAAVNAKLKSIVDKQKAAKAMKNTSGLSGTGDRVRTFIHDELEVIAGHKEALQARENFIKERTSLKSQLNHCQQELRTTLNSSERTEIDQKITHLQNEIEERTHGISNLQKTLSDLDKVKETSTGKWEMLQTMTEAKIGLEYLIDQCSTAQANYALLRSEHDDTLKQNDNLAKTISNLQKKLDKVSSVHEDQICQMSRDHEEKVLFLLRQFQGKEGDVSSDVEARLKIQETEINKMSHLNEVLIEMKEENNRLKTELDNKNLPAPSLVKKSSKPSNKTVFSIIEEETDNEDVSIDERDDYHNDPDWKKTPLYNRIRSLKERSMGGPSNSNKRKLDMMSEGSESDDEKTNSPPKTRKRSSFPGCKCKGKCSDGRCSCRKNGRACEECSCQDKSCLNRSTPLMDISNNPEGNTLSILNDDSLNATKDNSRNNSMSVLKKNESSRRVSHFDPPTIP